jgi:hypothetical protein
MKPRRLRVEKEKEKKKVVSVNVRKFQRGYSTVDLSAVLI